MTRYIIIALFVVAGTARAQWTGVGTDETQTLTNKTIDGDDNTLRDIDPTSIKPGSVDSTELGYVDGVTSAIQTQFAEKLALSGGTMTGQLVLDDDTSTAPTQWTLRSAAPDTPSAGDMYADDGTNTLSGDPGLRVYGGAAWFDMGGGVGTVDTSGTPVDDDIAVFTDADTIEGQTVSELGLVEESSATQTFVLPFTIPDDDGDIGEPRFEGTGTNDLFTSGTYSSQSALTYVVEIDGTGTPDTFKWSDDGGSTWDASTVSITGSAQTLNNGVQVKLLATTGHSNADTWTFLTSGAETDDLQFQVQLDDTADYTSTIIDHDSRDAGDGGDGQTGCEYFNGSAFVAWPGSGGTGAGVAEAYHGNSGSYSFTSSSVSRGTKYYWRVRHHDGTSWGNWSGRTISW